jgi:hypothetical protein
VFDIRASEPDVAQLALAHLAQALACGGRQAACSKPAIEPIGRCTKDGGAARRTTESRYNKAA